MCNSAKIEWIPTTDGEANFYGFANPKDWLMRVQVNGEVCDYHQARIINLISAAPDMHKALNEIIAYNRMTAHDKYGDEEKAETWACVKAARKALAKAEGNLNATDGSISP